ncbi:hypothetical protein [Clostridium perfringens]|uniref:hypothetical protein n=1 Tax=Clostridium perfringens TaxID=1502 RepID=UPI0024688488|nr:hypothetical protein [Clostridium perfringens]MDH5068066.1 hypothetical protein [Clostridium perfringens]
MENLNFFELDREKSNKYDGLTKAQELILDKINEGFSINKIAQMFNVHFTTIKNRTKSLIFVEHLTKISNAIGDLTIIELKDELTKIIKTSNNDNIKIKAIQVLIYLKPVLTKELLAEILLDDISQREGLEEIIKSAGLNRDHYIGEMEE